MVFIIFLYNFLKEVDISNQFRLKTYASSHHLENLKK